MEEENSLSFLLDFINIACYFVVGIKSNDLRDNLSGNFFEE
jgi:hypothetical protein